MTQNIAMRGSVGTSSQSYANRHTMGQLGFIAMVLVCMLCSGCNFYSIDPKSCTMDPEHNPTAKPCEKHAVAR